MQKKSVFDFGLLFQTKLAIKQITFSNVLVFLQGKKLSNSK